MSVSKFFFFIPLYFVFSFINLTTKLKLTPAWFNGTLFSNHQKLLAFKYTNNEQSRLLQFYIPEFLHKCFGVSVIEGYILQRWIFVFLAFLLFHLFLLKWFSHLRAFACVCVLSMIMPFTFFNHLQESSPLLMVTFILGIWFIRDQKPLHLSGVLIFGVLNNETMLVLSSLWFICRVDSYRILNILKSTLNTLIISFPSILVLGCIRYFNWDRPHLGEAVTLFKNIQNIILDLQISPLNWYQALYLNIFFVFGFMWLYLFKGLKNKPEFFQKCLWFLPIFILPHFLTGVIYEVRQMLPIAYIIIPMTLILI